MPKLSIMDISHQSDEFDKQLALWHLMQQEKRERLIEEIRSFIVSVREFEHRTKGVSEKSELQSIIEIWEVNLHDYSVEYFPSRAVLAKRNKTSHIADEIEQDKNSVKTTKRSRNLLADFFLNSSQVFCDDKVDLDASIPIPRRRKYRKMQDNIYGIVNS